MFSSAPNGMTTILSSPCVASEKTVMVKKITKNILLFIGLPWFGVGLELMVRKKGELFIFLRDGRSA